MRTLLSMNKETAIDLFCSGKTEEAYDIFSSLLKQGMEDADIYCHLGILNENKGLFVEAVDKYNKALELNPNLVPALANLGNQLKNIGHLSLAAEKLQKAAELEPKNSLICSNYANVLVCMGEHKAAYREYEKALNLLKQNLNAHSNFLLSLNYTEAFTPEQVLRFHKEFGKFTGEIPEDMEGYSHSKLRVAYISGDFKRHSVAYFIEGILHYHDRDKFEIYCYSDVLKPDVITKKIQSMDLIFKDIRSLSDIEVHKLVKKDEVDILIDLGGHTGKRLQVFAYRSAPVQASYIGYGNTTGLENMDFRIVDNITDTADSLASEELIRLKRSFLAFCPPENPPKIQDTPAIKKSCVTFGSFNNLPKLTDEVIRLWIRILRKVPNSEIILKTRAFIDESIKESVLNKFTSRGIDSERIHLIGYQSTLADHLVNYQKIDIALDPFPYNGTTTTCEALHMGVPVICLMGKTHIARVTGSLLEHSGLGSLVAKSKQEYVEKAVQLASDIEFLNNLHLKIRNVMHQSQICDSQGLTKELEKLYLQKAKRPAEASLS